MAYLATMKNTITDDCFTYQEDRSRKDNLGFLRFFLIFTFTNVLFYYDDSNKRPIHLAGV
jgi:hypothetical protein